MALPPASTFRRQRQCATLACSEYQINKATPVLESVKKRHSGIHNRVAHGEYLRHLTLSTDNPRLENRNAIPTPCHLLSLPVNLSFPQKAKPRNLQWPVRLYVWPM